MARPCLYVAGRPGWGDNRFCDLLRARGERVEVVCPAAGDALPESAAGGAGVIVGGGLDDVLEGARRPHVDALIGLARACLRDRVRFLGFCFGAQVLAAAGGGRVLVRDDGRGAFGYRPIRPGAGEGEAVLGGLDHAYFLHYHGFEAPPDAVTLARGELFPDSAFRLGPCAWGFQFHPEIRADQVEAIVTDLGPGALERPGADALACQRRDAALHDSAVHRWLDGFVVHRFLAAAPAQTACA